MMIRQMEENRRAIGPIASKRLPQKNSLTASMRGRFLSNAPQEVPIMT